MATKKTSDGTYARLARAIEGEPLPCALVDLDAVDRNVATIVAPATLRKKTIRVATKSIRSLDLIRYVLERGGDAMRGVMAYSSREARWLVENGLRDVLVAYPTALRSDARLVAEANATGAVVSLAADDRAHLEAASAAAKEVGTRIPIVVDIDAAYRPIGDRLPIGVKRSPLSAAAAVADFVELVLRFPDLTFGGLLAYEAHIAGLQDDSAAGAVRDAATRAMKSLAVKQVVELRKAIEREIHRRGISIPLFNGGGTGSVASSAEDAALTEIAAGSGFLDSHLFDGYRGLGLAPAAFFALQISRRPNRGHVTCHSGGFIASGAIGRDRLPIPAYPEHLALTDLEGAGEVQTPIVVPRDFSLPLGAPIFFRHAKAGELAEHFDEYLLVRGDRAESRAKTYRGAGRSFH